MKQTLIRELRKYFCIINIAAKNDDAKAQAQAEAAFATQLRQSFQTIFGEQQGLLNNLIPKLESIFNAGPNQSGFGTAQEAAMRTSAAEGLSTNFANASAATAERNRQTMGGMELPSGLTALLNANLQGQNAAAQAGAQRDITLQGAELGRANFFQAGNMLSGLASGPLNPNGLAGQATAAGHEAYGDTYQANKSNWGQIVAGLAGGLGGAFLGGGSGGFLGSLFGGGGSGGTDPNASGWGGPGLGMSTMSNDPSFTGQT